MRVRGAHPCIAVYNHSRQNSTKSSVGSTMSRPISIGSTRRFGHMETVNPISERPAGFAGGATFGRDFPKGAAGTGSDARIVMLGGRAPRRTRYVHQAIRRHDRSPSLRRGALGGPHVRDRRGGRDPVRAHYGRVEASRQNASAGSSRAARIETLANRPVSAAVLPRKIDEERPTLLLDESDAAFGAKSDYSEALRGILNSGYRRSGSPRCALARARN